MFNIWSFLTHRSRFGIILVITVLVLGTYAIAFIPKESAPEVDVPIAIVATSLPGGSPEDVEKLVTDVLEKPLKNRLADVNRITSNSSEGLSSITVEFTASADIDKSVQKLRDEVDAAKGQLPDEAGEPRIIEIDFAGEPVVTATLAADIPEELLYQLGSEVEDELLKVRGVGSVTVGGVREREVVVLVRRGALSSYNLTIEDVARAVAGADVALPLGSIREDDAEFPVRFSGGIGSVAELGGVPVATPSGSPVYLRDVADIIDGRARPQTMTRTSVGGNPSKQSISFDVFKSSDANITTVSADVREKLSELEAKGGLLEGMQVLIMLDRGELLVQDLSTLTRSGIQTILLVTLVLILAVGWREALIAAVSIPLSFLIAFIGLYYSGNTLNFVSLFALVLSIGIIVDSTIVIVEGINRRLAHMAARRDEESARERVETKASAALLTVREFHVPLTAGTLTTVAVFAPIFIVSGIVGEFIASIPFTVIFVLSASLFVALGLVPLFASMVLRRGAQFKGRLSKMRDEYVGRIEGGYREYLSGFLASTESQNTFFVTLVAMFALAVSLPIIGAVETVFFDDDNSEYLYVEAELPVGTVLSRTDLEMRKVEEALYAIPEIGSFVATAGRTSPFSDPFGGASSAERFGNIFINLKDSRERLSLEIISDIRRRLADINTATIRVDQLSDGPPSLAPVTITITGDDLAELDSAALAVEGLLKSIPGTADVTSSVKNGTSEFVIEIDRAKAASAGASALAVAQNLRTALFGDTATEIKEGSDDVDVVVKVDLSGAGDPHKANQTTLEALRQITVATPQGAVPISSFVTTRVLSSRASIAHEDGERIARVSSRLEEGANALRVSTGFEKRLNEINLPRNLEVTVGGESEDIDQSFRDLFVALFLGVIGMFAILVLQFNSFRYAGYVLLIVPLALIGVFVGLMVTGSSLSFPSIMGFIALSGIVVNNSIILIDTINNRRREAPAGTPLKDVVLEATVSRLRPVVLTALTTVIGIAPLLFAAALWVPLAWAIMFGLAFSTIITLLLVPAIYLRWPGSTTAN
ncbi:MAG: efflux RND transporter permease subunit [bacterium]|nr:efflux RND transporter permease subunit [bacterium]